MPETGHTTRRAVDPPRCRRLARPCVLALLAVALSGSLVISGCGSDDEDVEQAEPVQTETREADTAAEQRRARERGKLIERFQREEQRRAQENVEKFESGERSCGPGEAYNPQLDICLD